MTMNGEYYGRREANRTLDEEFLDEDMLPWRQAELSLSISFDSSVRLQNAQWLFAALVCHNTNSPFHSDISCSSLTRCRSSP
jgi:hypothetical protein